MSLGESVGPCPIEDEEPFTNLLLMLSTLRSSIENKTIQDSFFQVCFSTFIYQNIHLIIIFLQLLPALSTSSESGISNQNMFSYFSQIENRVQESVSLFQQVLTSQNISSPDIIQKNFIEKELSLMSSIMNGDSVDHHMEPSYFNAFQNIIFSLLENKTSLFLRNE